MDITKRYKNIEASLYDVPEAIIRSKYYDFSYEWQDRETDEVVNGYLGSLGFDVIDFDGAYQLPGEIKQLLREAGFSTDNV